MDLHEYLMLPKHKEKKEIDKLIDYKNPTSIYAEIKLVLKKDKELSFLKTADQISGSVISNWFKHYDLMRVKYLAGHRFISSSERYNMIKIEELKQKILRVHPMG